MLWVLLFSTAMAHENWLCTTEASQVRGNQILACGIGEATNESEARSLALNNAKLEFSELCGASKDCTHQEYTVEPKRTTCEEQFGKWKCYRLLAYTLQTGVLPDGQKMDPALARSMAITQAMQESVYNILHPNTTP